MPEERQEVQITLNTIEELFAEPAADPFDPQSRYQTGIDEMAGQVRRMGTHRPERLVIRLPADAMEPDLLVRTRAAVGRYCAAKIQENQWGIDETRFQGRRDFFSSILIAALVVAVTVAVVYSEVFSPQLGMAITYWVGLALWVILWDPIWTYTYAWRPFRRERRVHEILGETELVIEPQG